MTEKEKRLASEDYSVVDQVVIEDMMETREVVYEDT